MKSLVFDTGPIISLTLNNLLWIIKRLKPKYGGHFYIPPAVKEELIDRPLQIKRFKFEALQTLRYLNRGILELKKSKEAQCLADRLLESANRIFIAKGRPLVVVHRAEMETIAYAVTLGADAVVIDERTTAALLEDPFVLQKVMEKRLHTSVDVDAKELLVWKKYVKKLRVIRSVELALVAYEFGLLDSYVPMDLPEPDRTLLDAVLWGVKLDGCAVSEQEIYALIGYARHGRTVNAGK